MAVALAQPSPSQPPKPIRGATPGGTPLTELGGQINENTIAVISGTPNGTYLQLAYDMTAVLDDGDNLRVLAIIGKGGGQNMKDVRLMKGIDIGIVTSSVLNYYKRTNELGRLDDKIVYLNKLFNDEMHLVVRPDITSIEQLRGKTVNFNDAGSSTQLTLRDVLARLDIPVKEVTMGQADAFEAMRRGEVAATVIVAGKPVRAISTLKAKDGFRLLPVPFAKPLQADYLPTTLTSADYPDLIPPGQTVETIAVDTILIAYNWPKGTDRYRRLEKFTNAFFSKIDEFRKPPRHPKWRNINLSATLPGWTRFPAAEEWLRANANRPSQSDFEQFLAASGFTSASREDQERMFQRFLKWNQERAQR